MRSESEVSTYYEILTRCTGHPPEHAILPYITYYIYLLYYVQL